MRKVCKRKHYDTRVSTIDYVLNGMLPISITSPITTVRIKNHDALAQCAKGRADYQAVDTLVAAFNMAEALIHLGVGAEYKQEIRTAQDAITAMASKSRMLFTGEQLTSVNLGMDIHDAQLDDSRTTISTMEQALEMVKKVIRQKKARKLEIA